MPATNTMTMPNGSSPALNRCVAENSVDQTRAAAQKARFPGVLRCKVPAQPKQAAHQCELDIAAKQKFLKQPDQRKGAQPCGSKAQHGRPLQKAPVKDQQVQRAPGG